MRFFRKSAPKTASLGSLGYCKNMLENMKYRRLQLKVNESSPKYPIYAFGFLFSGFFFFSETLNMSAMSLSV